MRFLTEKKYQELLNKIERKLEEIADTKADLKSANDSIIRLDKYNCELMKQKYALEIALNETESELAKAIEQIVSQKQTNRRLINIMFGKNKKILKIARAK